MKKVSMVLLLVIIMVLSMTSCGNMPEGTVRDTPEEVIECGSWQFEVQGSYYLTKLRTNSIVYQFEEPYDNIVVYQSPGATFLLGEKSSNKKVDYFANIFIRDAEFEAFSDKYVLIKKKGNLVAVTINQDNKANGSINLLQEYSFDELIKAEKDAFIYPVTSKSVTTK